MGLLSFLFGNDRSKSAVTSVRVAGDGTYSVEPVGESHYQDALSDICGGPCEDGHEFACIAHLVPEPTNPFDRNAVAVLVNGRKVAHLARDEAVEHLADLRGMGLAGREVNCSAIINGGWLRPRRGQAADIGHFGIELDLIRPMRSA